MARYADLHDQFKEFLYNKFQCAKTYKSEQDEIPSSCNHAFNTAQKLLAVEW
jgi:hypothetical protein